MVQTYIPGRYWRVVATNEQAIRVYTMPSDSRGITALPSGRERDVVEMFEPELGRVAVEAVRAVGGVMMGVDVIEDLDGRLWIIEANVAFGFNVGDDEVETAILRVCEDCARTASMR